MFRPSITKLPRNRESFLSTVLQDLTVGLENAGHMDQAATVQRFNELSGPEDVKQLAAQVVATIKK